MLKQIILHIGSPKTGTSIIQSHLAQNREVLRDRGFFYPVTISKNPKLYRSYESHHLLTYAWADWEPFNQFDARRFFEWCQEICETHNLHTLLLSAENTYWLPIQTVGKSAVEVEDYWPQKRKYVETIRRALGNFPVKIVIYLRRQDHWLESWFNQQVKNGNALSTDIAKFNDDNEILLNYLQHLDLWSDVFGIENIVVRPYEKAQLTDGLLADFASETGIGSTVELATKVAPRYNAKLDRDALEFMNLCNSLELSADDKYWLRIATRKVTNQFSRQEAFTPQGLISPSQRQLILERYKSLNLEISNKYLNGAVLFQEQTIDSSTQSGEYAGLSVEASVKILVKLMLEMRGDSAAENSAPANATQAKDVQITAAEEAAYWEEVKWKYGS